MSQRRYNAHGGADCYGNADGTGGSASDRKSATAALWAIAIALAVIAAILALVVMMNASG